MAPPNRPAGKKAPGMRDELTSLSEELEALGQHLARLGELAVADGNAKLTEEIDLMQKRYEEALDLVAGKSRRAMDRIEEVVQQHPLNALMTAFAAGALLAMLLRRRH